MKVPIRAAGEAIDPEQEARWAARRADRQDAVLRSVLRCFLDREGPVPVTDVHAALPDRPAAAVGAALDALDEKDLLVLGDGRIELAYPFSGHPSAFSVILRDGRERFACCAIDALGIAAMLRERIHVRSSCHHCGEAIGFTTEAGGPGPDAEGIMVWVGPGQAGERRVATSL